MILSAIWNELNELTELHENRQCNSLKEFNSFQMARKIVLFDSNQMDHEKSFLLQCVCVKINLRRLHGKAFNMGNINRFFFCLKECKLTTHLIML